MGAYIIRRLLLVIPTLVGIMIINFALTQFVPGGPIEQIIARMEGGGDVFETISGGGSELTDGGDSEYAGARGLPADFIAELEREFGFDKPPLERFLTMMWNYVRFDFGESYFKSETVVNLVLDKMPVSISLGLWSTLIAYFVSIPLGIRKALRDGSTFDTWTSGAIIIGYAIPGFLFAILMIVLFAGGSYFRVFPLRGLTGDDFDQMTALGRFGLYWPWMLAMLAAALGASRYLQGRMSFMAAGLIGLGAVTVLAALVAGNTFGTNRLHLIVPLLIAAGGLWGAHYVVKRRLDPAQSPFVDFALIIAVLSGMLLAMMVVGLLSVSGLIPQTPAGFERPEGQVVTLFGQVGDYFWHIFLPVFVQSIGAFATLTLLTKNSFLDEIKKQYVMTAKAKGLAENRVLYGHVFRNAMLIVISGFPAIFISVFFGGSVIIETLFSLDGLGRLFFEAAVARDYPIVFGTLFAFTLLGLLVSIITDLCYVLIDPRIDFEARG